MKAQETVAAAIAKLETLRDRAPSKGTWVRNESESHDALIVTHNGEWVVRDAGMFFSDANLIIALHATAEAQLLILRWFAESLADQPGFEPPVRSEHMGLALAILGSDS
jgi:hypothetical protein